MDRRQWMVKSGYLGVAACGCLVGCKSAPVTGRKQLMLVPEEQEVSLGRQTFAEVLAESPITDDAAKHELVERVGMQLAAVSGRDDYDWETRVVASSEQNAYCLPGGKIVVYEGILPICQNEAGLAVVLGHEVAHVLARHGGERMSQQSAVNGAKTMVAYATRRQEEVSRDLWMRAYGVATTYGVVLPYSRKHESEADHIGLMLMAEAGYDPAEAPRFWQRFAAAGNGPNQPEFLSTHPADQRRASDLEKLLPEALGVYREASTKLGIGQIIA